MTTSTATEARSFQAADLAFVAVFAALIAALSLMPPIPIGPLGIPITLQTLGVALCGLLLGPWRGAAAVLLYVAVGVAGLPVFAGGKAGLAVLVGPTGGYLVSFIFHALVVGFIARAIMRKGLKKLTPVWLFLGLFISRVLVIYPIGTLGMMLAAKASFADVWMIDFPFWPGDAIKSVVAVLVAIAVYKAFPRLLGR